MKQKTFNALLDMSHTEDPRYKLFKRLSEFDAIYFNLFARITIEREDTLADVERKIELALTETKTFLARTKNDIKNIFEENEKPDLKLVDKIFKFNTL